VDEGTPPEPWLFGFICVHAGRQNQPILYVSRQVPIEPQDSGWCFGCGQAGHLDNDWLLVRADRYFEEDQSLAQLWEMPAGHAAERLRPGEEWIVVSLPPDPA